MFVIFTLLVRLLHNTLTFTLILLLFVSMVAAVQRVQEAASYIQLAKPWRIQSCKTLVNCFLSNVSVACKLRIANILDVPPSCNSADSGMPSASTTTSSQTDISPLSY